MKKVIASILLCSALLMLSACISDSGNNDNEAEEVNLQRTINSQDKIIEEIKKENIVLKNDREKNKQVLRQKNEEIKQKDKEIKRLKNFNLYER